MPSRRDCTCASGVIQEERLILLRRRYSLRSSRKYNDGGEHGDRNKVLETLNEVQYKYGSGKFLVSYNETAAASAAPSAFGQPAAEPAAAATPEAAAHWEYCDIPTNNHLNAFQVKFLFLCGLEQ